MDARGWERIRWMLTRNCNANLVASVFPLPDSPDIWNTGTVSDFVAVVVVGYNEQRGNIVPSSIAVFLAPAVQKLDVWFGKYGACHCDSPSDGLLHNIAHMLHCTHVVYRRTRFDKDLMISKQQVIPGTSLQSCCGNVRASLRHSCTTVLVWNAPHNAVQAHRRWYWAAEGNN